MNECFIHVQKDRLKIRVLFVEFDLFARCRYFKCFSETKYLNTLIKMLPV